MKTITYTAALTLVMSVMTACGTKSGYDATGIFEATTVTVSAETSGRILEFDIEEGDSVMVGRQVALVDTVLLSLQQGQSESQRRSATASSPDIEAQASSLRSQIAHAENEVRRQQKLLASGATTQVIADDAEAQLKALRGQLEALLSTLGKSRNSIADNASAIHYQRQQIAQQIARCHIMSPITGTVLDKYAEAGEYAVPGKPLFKIADLGNIYLRAYFTASQLADLRIGQRVTVIADFGGDKQFEYPGTITWIADESEFTPKSIQTEDSRANLVYAVKVAVKNDGRLKLGQYGEVRL